MVMLTDSIAAWAKVGPTSAEEIWIKATCHFFMLNNVFTLDGILVFITNHFQVLLVSFLLITSFYGPGEWVFCKLQLFVELSLW